MSINSKTQSTSLAQSLRSLTQILQAIALKEVWCAFHSIRSTRGVRRNDNKKKEKRGKTIQQEFIHHCAVVIQSRFRAFLQRKRYRAFLPIYRRVKELLLAVYSGWKIRKIFKLQPIKSQINDIKLKIKNSQVSSSRIAKRELIGDIDRLSKKGRWVQVVNKFRLGKVNRLQKDLKQNSSLYANVKSKSIKNIFKKEEVKSKEEGGKVKKTQHFEKSSKNQESMSIDNHYQTNPIRTNNFDQIPIKAHKQNISVCETQSQPIHVPVPRNASKHDYLKKGQKQQNKLNDIKTARSKIPKNIKQAGPSLPKKQQSVSTHSKQAKPIPQQIKKEQQQIDQRTILSQSQISKSSQISKKKIQITLATPIQSSLQSNNKSLDESTIDMKTIKESIIHLDFTGINEGLAEIITVFKDKYLEEKNKIKQKVMIMQNKYTGRDCKRIIKDF